MSAPYLIFPLFSPTVSTSRVHLQLISAPRRRSSPLSLSLSLSLSLRSRMAAAAAAALITAASTPFPLVSFRSRRDGHLSLSPPRRPGAGRCRASAPTFQGGPAASYAREMERLSAKESLLLAFRDAGGFESLVSGKTTGMQKIDVNERIVGLERLNPTPRPTTRTSIICLFHFTDLPFWKVDGTLNGLVTAVLEHLQPVFCLRLDVLIKDGYSKISSNVKFLNTVQSKFLLTTQLSVEGPIRMKEEYVEGLIEIPRIREETLPDQLKGFFGQTAGALQQLPAPIRDAVSEGIKLPLNGMFQRLFMISYLDEEILIIRDASGAPDVLTRLEGPQPNSIDGTSDAVLSEYES
uniref:Plastid lipid-associated protein/fibrillin conserved domain-containing protein n=2 Tax=Oryza TaxID=4527 RepID=A0A0D9ZS29_9ORYZ